jgi:hypothetical protein
MLALCNYVTHYIISMYWYVDPISIHVMGERFIVGWGPFGNRRFEISLN